MIPLLSLLLALPASAMPLSEISRQARYAPDCADIIGLEHAPSFPVPVMTKSGLAYRQLYYPVLADGVYSPGAVVQFDPAGKTTCKVGVSLPPGGSGKSLGAQLTPQAARMSHARYQADAAKLFAAVERAGKAFAAGKPDPKAAAEFTALFDVLSEPPLRPAYRALSPEFWAWLEKK